MINSEKPESGRRAGIARGLRPDRLLRRINLIIGRAGPYRFTTRRYFGTRDIAMTSRLLEVEAFRHDIVPQPLPLTTIRSVLVLAPHQDDEVIGAGGFLVKARDAGIQISIVFCTDGQQKSLNKEIRREEARNVCEKLTAKMFELNISNIEPRPTVDDLIHLNEIVRVADPDVILCPWLLDGAPKHRMVNHLLWLANRLTPLPDVEFWGYQVQNTLLPNGYVDITEVADEKRALLECFQSQNEERHWDHVAMGLAAWNSRLVSKSAHARYIETFFTLPKAELMKLIEEFYFGHLLTTYVGESNLASNLDKLHQSIMRSKTTE